MGGNGTASVTGSVENKEYVSHGTYTDPIFGEIEIVEWTAGGNNKSPEESNSAPRMYATFYKDGSGVNEIAKYGEDHKKIWAIHSVGHDKKVTGPHVHEWNGNGRPDKPYSLTESDPRLALLHRVQNFQKTKK